MASNLPRLACAFVFLMMAPVAGARTVSWFSGVGDSFLHTSGSTSWDSSLRFELGAFALGFTPTSANISQWAANWMIFDEANAANGHWNPTAGYFVNQAMTIAADTGAVHSTGDTTGMNEFWIYTGSPSTYQPAYIWAYNSKTLGGASEWALVGNAGWTFPAPAVLDPIPVEFYLGNAMASLGSLVVNPATFETTLRTVAVHAPEPQGLMPLGVVAALFARRRRK